MGTCCEAFLPRDAMQARYAVMRYLSVLPSVCLSARPSVTCVDHVKTNKHILELFSPSSLTKRPVIPQQLYKTASRGLSAIAELLVIVDLGAYCIRYRCLDFY